MYIIEDGNEEERSMTNSDFATPTKVYRGPDDRQSDGATGTSSEQSYVEMDDDANELESSSFHVPVNGNINDILFDNNSKQDMMRNLNLTTPVNLNIKDLMQPLEDWGKIKSGIRERKYPVLPSIGPPSQTNSPRLGLERSDTLNQLDYTREKIEGHADFFADFRVNTCVAKITPRHNPLPPIRQTLPKSYSKS